MKGTNILKGKRGTENVPMDTTILSQVYIMYSVVSYSGQPTGHG